jgi:hypothetical protein
MMVETFFPAKRLPETMVMELGNQIATAINAIQINNDF